MTFVKNTLVFSAIALLIIMSACGSKFKYPVKKGDNMVSVQMDSLLINIEIMNESIIHVQKSKTGIESLAVPDYVTVLEPQNVAWNIEESQEQIAISTDAVTVTIHIDGTITYFDAAGEQLLAETNELSYIKPSVDGESNVSQAFVAGNEALYGLGQFQSGIMNWKNVPIRLQQYNQEIVVPFLVSTKGYGIYWHNYSLTDINTPQNVIEFETVGAVAVQNEDAVIPEGGEKENVAAYVSAAAQEKNVRETTFSPKQSGVYTFMALSDNDGRMRGEIKVTIDGDEIIDYETIWVPRRYSGKKYLEAGKEYKVVFQNTGAKIPGQLFYNSPDYNKTVFSSQLGGTIDYYFVHGENPGEVIAQNHTLTGKAPMFAKSAYGFWQCRERYHNQKELLENAREMRKRGIPFDNIVQDWFYWPEGTKGPEWDRKKYPNAKAMVDELKELNLKLMVSVWPEVKNDPLIEKYDLDIIKGSHFVDIYDKGTADRFYRMLSDSMFHLGVSSIWLDGTEPEGVTDTKALTAVGPFEVAHNSYSLEVARTMYEGRKAEFPNERVFNLTRSAYSGQQRYGATSWSGDTEASWRQFSEQIAAGLNFTMAGVPYWTHDIGGFFRDSKSINPRFDSQYTNPEFIELLTRWFQYGAFSPIFRIHGYVSETEIWRYNKAFESTARKFIDLRYQLMPYIYSQAWQITTNSRQLMSPLAYHYPEDAKTWEIKDQMFFGESIMVGLVTEYKQRKKDIYLPEGDWYNFWTNEVLKGGTTVNVDAALDETPMFVKAGSIIPMGPKVQYATEETKEPLTINVYPGKDAEYVLYLDDNETYDYEGGEFSEVLFSYNEAAKKLTITKGNGSFIDFAKKPINMLVKIAGQETAKEVSFKGTETIVSL